MNWKEIEVFISPLSGNDSKNKQANSERAVYNVEMILKKNKQTLKEQSIKL